MRDFDLNTGGVLGGLSCGVLTFVFVLMASRPGPNGDAVGRLFVLATIVGAVIGNYLWKTKFKKNDSQSDDEWNN